MHKEIHHFDKHGEVHPGGARLLQKLAAQLNIRAERPGDLGRGLEQLKPEQLKKETFKMTGRSFELDQTNLEFLRKFCVYVDGGAADQAYLDLFTPYSDYLSGDVTPAYSTLDLDAIRRVQALIPEARIILCVRDPVARLWSQLNMRIRRDFKAEHDRLPKAKDRDEFNRLLSQRSLEKLANQNNFMSRSMASQVYRKWTEVFGEERLLVINFEDLTKKTGQVLDKVSLFLGVEPQANKIIPGNKVQNAMKIAITDEQRETLRQVLGSEIEDYSSLFDHHRDRV